MSRSKLAIFMGLTTLGHIGIPLDMFGGLLPLRKGSKRHRGHTVPGTAKSYFDRPGSGLLTREEIDRRRRGNPKGAY